MRFKLTLCLCLYSPLVYGQSQLLPRAQDIQSDISATQAPAEKAAAPVKKEAEIPNEVKVESKLKATNSCKALNGSIYAAGEAGYQTCLEEYRARKNKAKNGLPKGKEKAEDEGTGPSVGLEFKF